MSDNADAIGHATRGQSFTSQPAHEQGSGAFGFKEEVQRGSVGNKDRFADRAAVRRLYSSVVANQTVGHCAPQVILTEAGGRLTDLFGYPLNYNVPDVQNRNGLIASNGFSHDQIVESLAPLLNEFGRNRVS